MDATEKGERRGRKGGDTEGTFLRVYFRSSFLHISFFPYGIPRTATKKILNNKNVFFNSPFQSLAANTAPDMSTPSESGTPGSTARHPTRARYKETRLPIKEKNIYLINLKNRMCSAAAPRTTSTAAPRRTRSYRRKCKSKKTGNQIFNV